MIRSRCFADRLILALRVNAGGVTAWGVDPDGSILEGRGRGHGRRQGHLPGLAQVRRQSRERRLCLEFILWNALASGAHLGGTQSANRKTVVSGRFTVVLHDAGQLGAQAFDSGAPPLAIALLAHPRPQFGTIVCPAPVSQPRRTP